VTVLVGEMSGSYGGVYQFTDFWDVAPCSHIEVGQKTLNFRILIVNIDNCDEQMIDVLRIIEIIEANWIQM
jgi:hypothetical protein